ncbi:MAG TPA: RNA polymerase sigma factor [Polyangiaceae bacterium]|nr:RNA polymerase sigma factor [Polyangiaceae bacterium]
MSTCFELELRFPGPCALLALPQPRDIEPEAPPETSPRLVAAPAFEVPTFEQVYVEAFRPVWRLVRRMGVIDTLVDDVVQDVFVVVYRKLPQFSGASSVKTWVLAITLGVVRNYRRAWRRKGAGFALAAPLEDPDLIADGSLDPHEQLSRAQAAQIVQQLLGEMDDDKASLFILVEIEGLSAAEIARALGVKVQTIYSRLAAARRDFERGLRRIHRGESVDVRAKRRPCSTLQGPFDSRR